MALVTTAIQKFQSSLDDALAAIQDKKWTDLVSMMEHGDKEAKDWKDLGICDQLCRKITIRAFLECNIAMIVAGSTDSLA